MSKRLLSKVGGFVHDINVVSSLSDEPNNIRLLSDRSLYILQNLSSEDITFLSRYGTLLTGDFYLPVLAGSAEETDVEDAIDIMRRDLNSMAVDVLLQCICDQLEELVAKTSDTNQEVEGAFSDGLVPIGEGQQFETQSEYFDAKCNVANGIFDTIREFIQWLEDNDVDVIAGVFGGVTSGVLVGLGLAGPVGWALAIVSATTVTIAGFIIAYALDFEDVGNALDSTHSECVMALFNAGDAKTAEDNYITAVEAGSPTITSLESDFLRILVSSEVANQLFVPRSDVAVYDSPSPIDCGASLLASWTFPVDVEGWVFRDDSTGSNTASGAYNASLLALGITLHNVPSTTEFRAIGTWTKTGLSIVVTPGASAQFDFSAPSDSVVMNTNIKVIYSDASEEEVTLPGSTSAGTIVLTLTQSKTIAEIECNRSRSWSRAGNPTTDVEEVRVFGA